MSITVQQQVARIGGGTQVTDEPMLAHTNLRAQTIGAKEHTACQLTCLPKQLASKSTLLTSSPACPNNWRQRAHCSPAHLLAQTIGTKEHTAHQLTCVPKQLAPKSTLLTSSSACPNNWRQRAHCLPAHLASRLTSAMQIAFLSVNGPLSRSIDCSRRKQKGSLPHVDVCSAGRSNPCELLRPQSTKLPT